MSVRYQTPEGLREALTGFFGYTAIGVGAARTMAELQAHPVIGRYGERLVRRAIAELVVLDRVPIAGDSRAGYYRCETAAERHAQMAELVGRIRSLALRVRTFAEVTATEQGGQLRMDWTATPVEIAARKRQAERLLALLDEEEGDE